MKKLFAILSFALFSLGVSAQATTAVTTGTPAQDRATKAVHKMQEQIQLTKDQEKQVFDIMVTHYTQMEKLRTDQRPAAEVQRDQEAQRDQTDRSLAEVLTQDQMLKYRQMRKENKANNMGGH